MSRPSEYPEFAIDDVNDPITGQPNVIEPDGSQKGTGWVNKQKPPYQFFNWLHRKVNQWIQYLTVERDSAEVRLNALEFDINYILGMNLFQEVGYRECIVGSNDPGFTADIRTNVYMFRNGPVVVMMIHPFSVSLGAGEYSLFLTPVTPWSTNMVNPYPHAQGKYFHIPSVGYMLDHVSIALRIPNQMTDSIVFLKAFHNTARGQVEYGINRWSGLIDIQYCHGMYFGRYPGYT